MGLYRRSQDDVDYEIELRTAYDEFSYFYIAQMDNPCMVDIQLVIIDACYEFIKIGLDGTGLVTDGICEVIVRKDGEIITRLDIDRDRFEYLVKTVKVHYHRNPNIYFIGAEPTTKEGV